MLAAIRRSSCAQTSRALNLSRTTRFASKRTLSVLASSTTTKTSAARRVAAATTLSRISTRSFSSTPRAFNENDKGAAGQGGEQQEMPPWIEVLEGIADGPWLSNFVPDESMRLAIAHGLTYQLLLYLSRPTARETEEKEGETEAEREQAKMDAHAQYLSAFAVARVPATSEMARARLATAKLIKAVLFQLSSLPPTSPILTASENATLVSTYQALKDVSEAEGLLSNDEGIVQNWGEFWGHAQPIVVALVEELDKRGFTLKAEGPGDEPAQPSS